MNVARYADALSFAADAHAGQWRKSTAIPYITHPVAVSGLVARYGGDEDQMIAALLHDVVEDCDVSLATLEERFGARVASIVEGCTDGVPDASGRKPPWRERKEAYLRHLRTAPADVLLVSACDKLHNASCIVQDLQDGGDVFSRFTGKREGTLWYYGALTDTFSDLMAGSPVVRALLDTLLEMTTLAHAPCLT